MEGKNILGLRVNVDFHVNT